MRYKERAERASTLVATQLPVEDWQASTGARNHADAICDRLLHNAQRIELKGASLRKTRAASPDNPVEKTGSEIGS